MKTKLYIVRHGKTMFNTIGRAQGWSDTPLTEEGEKGIHELGMGLKEAGISFKVAFSSDSGRAIQTARMILEDIDQKDIRHTFDKRIREWCFGSFDGAYDGELFFGVLPRTKAFKGESDVSQLTYEDIAKGIMEVDTAGWAEPWDVIKHRIMTGFEDIARQLELSGGGNALVVSHGLTIATLLHLIDSSQPTMAFLDNGSVTELTYEDGQFTIETIGGMAYREEGAKHLE